MSGFPIMSDYEVTDEEREEYAFTIRFHRAKARARAKAEVDLQRRKDRASR